MKRVDLYGRVRHAVIVQGMSRREAARIFGIDRRTVDKMLVFSVPAGYRRKQAPARPKLDPFVGIIDRILEADRLVHKKQRHTSKRIFERLRDEHGFVGGITIVKDYVFAARRRHRESSRNSTKTRPCTHKRELSLSLRIMSEVHPKAAAFRDCSRR
jgi:transposase